MYKSPTEVTTAANLTDPTMDGKEEEEPKTENTPVPENKKGRPEVTSFVREQSES